MGEAPSEPLEVAPNSKHSAALEWYSPGDHAQRGRVSDTAFGVAVWNPTDEEQPLAITAPDGLPLTWHGPDDLVIGTLSPQGVALGIRMNGN